jgi:hypothetical protein
MEQLPRSVIEALRVQAMHQTVFDNRKGFTLRPTVKWEVP